MKITSVRVRVTEDAVEMPVTNAVGRVSDHFQRAWRTHIVEVFTDAGITGLVATDGANPTLKPLILNQLQPQIIGEDPRNYERLWRKMFGEPRGWRQQATKGEAIRAISAVDTAIWDLIAKAAKVSLCQALGGYAERIACYASGGHYVSTDSQREELAFLEAETPRFMEMGYKAIKIRVGRDVRLDCERAALVRKIIGPDTQLMMDFNFSQTYTGGAGRAIRFMKALEAYDPFWFEDPVIMDDLAGLRKICDAVNTPIATGEREQTVWGFRDLIERGGVDIIMPDVLHTAGGVTQWRAIAAFADAYRIPAVGHVAERTHVHCLASAPNGLMMEIFRPLETRRRMYEAKPIVPGKDGMVTVPTTPGLGIELNEDYIKAHLVE